MKFTRYKIREGRQNYEEKQTEWKVATTDQEIPHKKHRSFKHVDELFSQCSPRFYLLYYRSSQKREFRHLNARDQTCRGEQSKLEIKITEKETLVISIVIIEIVLLPSPNK